MIDSETSALEEFNSNFDDLLIGTVVMFVVVLAVDLVALVLHNILTCRSNTEGKTPRHRIEVYYCNYVITDCIVSASPSTFFFVWARVKNCRKLQKQNISSRNDE